MSISLRTSLRVQDMPQMEKYNAWVCCNTFCCDAFDCYGLGTFWENTQIQRVEVRDVHLLLEAAAYQDLENKLTPLSAK